MTTSDRISITSLVFSIVLPVGTYLWLRDSIRETQLMASALHVTGQVQLYDHHPSDDKPHGRYYVVLHNVGHVPISNISISVAHYNAPGTTFTAPDGIEPVAFGGAVANNKNGTSVITLARDLPPGTEGVTVHLGDVIGVQGEASLLPSLSATVSTDASLVAVPWIRQNYPSTSRPAT